MQKRLLSRFILVALLIWLVGQAPRALTAQALEPLVYTIKFPAPDTHLAEVEVRVPTGKRAAIDLMMAIWSPGFYRVENYASRVQELSVRTPDGKTLEVEQPQKNRWRIQTSGVAAVIVSYRLLCQGRSVTTNWVGDDLIVLNGGATFITLVEKARRPHEVKLELPAKWKQAMTGLDAAPGGQPNHFRAPDFDTLVDSPMVAGDLTVTEFEVDGSRHHLVEVGERGQWDSKRAAQDLEKIVRETRRFWGFLPFKRYVFLNLFRQGGGGLEHSNSTLLTSSPRMTTPTSAWLAFVSHEYFHAFNVKRLRPVELTAFDYENPPSTTGLWISEGLTTYFGDLMVVRAGLGTTQDHLARLSSHISSLQNSPGRLVQTLEQSSLDVWNSGTSGVGRDTATKISYYVKGPVVGFLLDAKIQRATGGEKSLDDVMRLAYQRYAGERGFRAEQFRQTTEEVAGAELKERLRESAHFNRGVGLHGGARLVRVAVCGVSWSATGKCLEARNPRGRHASKQEPPASLGRAGWEIAASARRAIAYARDEGPPPVQLFCGKLQVAKGRKGGNRNESAQHFVRRHACSPSAGGIAD